LLPGYEDLDFAFYELLKVTSIGLNSLHVIYYFYLTEQIMKIGILNGPILNLTGSREIDVYGTISFDTLLKDLRSLYNAIRFEYFQSNQEGDLVDRILEWRNMLDGIVINAGGYTHTSVAIADAIKICDIPVIEVHMSNIFSREDYRHISLLGKHTTGIISGFGMDSYIMAVEQLRRVIS